MDGRREFYHGVRLAAHCGLHFSVTALQRRSMCNDRMSNNTCRVAYTPNARTVNYCKYTITTYYFNHINEYERNGYYSIQSNNTILEPGEQQTFKFITVFACSCTQNTLHKLKWLSWWGCLHQTMERIPMDVEGVIFWLWWAIEDSLNFLSLVRSHTVYYT